MRPIDADAFKKYIDAQEGRPFIGCTVGEAMKILIDEQPTVQPEIIRCKDCKYWMPHSQLGYDEDNETYHDYCKNLIPEDEYYAFYRCADDYCSKAERRIDE